MNCPVCSWSHYDPDFLFIHESQYWRVVLAPNQSLVGRCAVCLKRHCGDVAETSPEEILDWLKIVSKMETALRNAFKATMFNWSCYMNFAYREDPPDPHIHWWMVPRYDHPVKLGELIFEDIHFGEPYDHALWRDVSKEIRNGIAESIRRSIVPKA